MNYKNDLIRGKMAMLSISAEKLADKTGFNVKTVHKVRHGEDVKVSTLATVTRALDMKLSDIVVDAPVEAQQEAVA
jgi:DNA-binding Xre family transcriptional regulator